MFAFNVIGALEMGGLAVTGNVLTRKVIVKG